MFLFDPPNGGERQKPRGGPEQNFCQEIYAWVETSTALWGFLYWTCYNVPMKNIGILIVVLIIGFLIGSFTGYGSTLFSFLNKGKFSTQTKPKVEKTSNSPQAR